jgi:hypothetical protein
VCGAGIGTDLTIGFVRHSDSGGAGAEAGCQTTDEHVGPKWSSKDPYVAELANAIEEKMPNVITGVDLPPTSWGEIDIEAPRYVIEVTSDSAHKTEQIQRYLENDGRDVAHFAPNYGPVAKKEIEKLGVPVFKYVNQAAEWAEARQ